MLAAFPHTKQITPYLLLHHSNNGVNQSALFMMRYPSLWRAKPRLKMMWWVLLTHNVLWGLRTCLPEPPNVPPEVMPEALRANRVTTPVTLSDAARGERKRTRSREMKG